MITRAENNLERNKTNNINVKRRENRELYSPVSSIYHFITIDATIYYDYNGEDLTLDP